MKYVDKDYLICTFPKGMPRTMAARYAQIIDLASEHHAVDEETGEAIVIPPVISWAEARALLEAEVRTTSEKDRG